MKTEKRSKAKQLRAKLEKQGYKCALSGLDLTPDCWELDHIVSMADGGTDEVDNLQCVHPLINKMKGTMGNAQFVEMCGRVSGKSAVPSGGLKGATR